jgi:hypothetical protein
MTDMTRTRLPLLSSDAMARLLPAAAPPGWRAAVGRAARMLGPSWGDGAPPADTGLLVLVVTVLALDREPGGASPAAIRAALAEAPDTGTYTEPHGLRRRGTAALGAAGQHDPTAGTWSPLGELWRDALHQWAPDIPTSDVRPAPSELSRTLPWLRAALDRADRVGETDLPDPPTPTPPPPMTITGMVRRVTPEAALPVRCDTCGAYERLTLRVDGPTVTVRCPAGHDTRPLRLDAARVAQAARYHGIDHTSGPTVVDGHLAITLTGDPRADPRALFMLDRHR